MIIPVPYQFRPHLNGEYPPDNRLIFEEWFGKNITENELSYFDRHYLPVYWTSYQCNSNYDNRSKNALRHLQNYIDKLPRSKKYFTIVQHDDGCSIDFKDLDILVFGASGHGSTHNIPLLSMPHPFKFNTHKDLIANFIGMPQNNPVIRNPIFKLEGKEGYYISSKKHNIEDYCKVLARSVFTLCPRGYGKTSFRIGEALQYGSIPVYISDDFILPYNDIIPFTDYGILTNNLSFDLNYRPKIELNEVYRKLYTYVSNKQLILQTIKKQSNTMLINLKSVLEKHNVNFKDTGVIQVGCHHAQEHEEYLKMGIERMVYIEPCKEAFVKLTDKFKDHDDDKNQNPRVNLVNCACADYNGYAEMFTSKDNLGMSNSLLAPAEHLKQHPHIKFNDKEKVRVKRLDDIMNLIGVKNCTILNMDVQGAEGLVLKGAPETIKKMDVIYCEVNRGNTYEGNMLIEDIDKLLTDFIRVETVWDSPNSTWGDAVWVRKDKAKIEGLKLDDADIILDEFTLEDPEYYLQDKQVLSILRKAGIETQVLEAMTNHAKHKKHDAIQRLKDKVLNQYRMDISMAINNI